ncbi:MAG: prepilin-type N-terminal cleavage/methylation domain-containing protein [Planctomycetota bacterium]
MRLTKSNGFTIVELIVVIAIITILAGMLFPALRMARQRGKIARARTDIANLEMGLAAYQEDNGSYPWDGGTPAAGGVTADPFDSEVKVNVSNKVLAAFMRGDISSPPDNRVDPGFLNAPYMDFKPEQLLLDGGFYLFIDPWGKAYGYDENRSEAAGSWQGKRRMTFDIWSAGVDEQYGWHNRDYTVSDPKIQMDKDTQDNINSW